MAAVFALGACSVIGESGADNDTDTTGSGDRSQDVAGTTLKVISHDSFSLPKPLLKSFQKKTGMKVQVIKSGDAGKMTNSLVLNHGNPRGDVAFGVDNTFASRAVDEGVFADLDVDLPEGAGDFALEGDGADQLAPVDQGSVCVNVDTAWFDKKGQEPPESLDDLTDPQYKDLTAVPGAATSSPGLAFLLATIAEYGDDGWQDYWSDLLGNGATLTEGWTDAYYGEFTGGGEGDRPIVVSYDSSPAFTVDKQSKKSTTAALLDTCFRQVEYAGILEGADNPAGAQLFIDFLLGDEAQSAIPDSMYMFPVSASATLPAEWAEFAVQPEDPYDVPADDIAAHRQEWLTDWNDLVTR
ncbi:MAG: thiamine ABC transporter substrate-binding protein [Nocardioides sp.]|nr:thiamine ABC transporter substrate-binding protein [Nocardioides sp.]